MSFLAVPLPPMFESWNPSTGYGSLYPEHCEVHLRARVYNADFLEWRHNGLPIYSIHTSPIHESEIHCKVTVTETTRGAYSCVAYNNRNTLSSRTPTIMISIDYGLASHTRSGITRRPPSLQESVIIPPTSPPTGWFSYIHV